MFKRKKILSIHLIRLLLSVFLILETSKVLACESTEQLSPLTLDEFNKGDFTSLQIKITHIGPQDKPVKSVVIHCFVRLPLFEILKSTKLSGYYYKNDDLPQVVNFSVNIDEIKKISNLVRNAWKDTIKQKKETDLFKSISVYLDKNGKPKVNVFGVRKDKWDEIREQLFSIFKSNQTASEALEFVK